GVNPHPKRNDSAVKNKALPSLIVNRKHGGRASIIHFSRSLTKKSLSNIDIVLFCIPIWSLYYGPVTLNIWFWPGFTPMFASTVQHGTDPCGILDRKSTRLNSSHVSISYAVFCLNKKRTNDRQLQTESE